MAKELTPPRLIDGSSFSTVTEQMRALIAHWEAGADPRCIFLDCYCTMTGNMLAALERERFHDRDWVSNLLHRFAKYYFEAVAAYEHPEKDAAQVWTLTLDASRQEKRSALQHLLLGVNAHINYDLALALRDLLHPEWESLSPAGVHRRYEDHLHVNQIIADTVDAVQDEVVERYMPTMDLIDRLFGPLDEWMTAHIIAEWRDQVWNSAIALLEAKDEEARRQVQQRLEERSLRLAHLFLLGSPGAQ